VARELIRTGRPSRRSRTEVSLSYLWLIERGRKVPDEPIAVAIAQAYGEDPRLYRAWVTTRKRADLESGIAAAETLRRLLRTAPAVATPPAAAPSPARDPGFARLRVPLVAAGVDPGDAVRPACEVLAWLRLDEGQLPAGARERLDRPFAIRADTAILERVRHRFLPGDRILVLRDFMPPSVDDVHAVRHHGRVLLSRVLWNGRQLLLLPFEGESDFSVLEARNETELRERILGVAVPLPPALEEVAP
jgi:hypothetical protein